MGPAQKIAGGIYCPTDETGDSHKFTRALGARCDALGAEFHTGTTITAIDTSGDAVTRCVPTARRSRRMPM